MGHTINVMTLGGMALAVGILVDDATVEIENVHRNMGMAKPLTRAILDGAQQIALPSFVSTLAICIVFVPVLLLTGPAKFLFTPLALAVAFAMMMSYFLTRTLVPTMVHYMLRSEVEIYAHGEEGLAHAKGFIWQTHHAFNTQFREDAREVSQRARLVPAPPRPRLHRLRPVRAGFARPRHGRRHRLLPLHRFRPAAPPCARARRHPHRRNRAHLRRASKTPSAATCEPGELDAITDNIGLPNAPFALAWGDSADHQRRPTAKS